MNQNVTVRELHGHLDIIREDVSTVKDEVAKLDTRVKVGFAILAVMIGSPKVGGPAAPEVVSTAARELMRVFGS